MQSLDVFNPESCLKLSFDGLGFIMLFSVFTFSFEADAEEEDADAEEEDASLCSFSALASAAAAAAAASFFLLALHPIFLAEDGVVL